MRKLHEQNRLSNHAHSDDKNECLSKLKACYETLHEGLSAAQPVAMDMSDACGTIGAFG